LFVALLEPVGNDHLSVERKAAVEPEDVVIGPELCLSAILKNREMSSTRSSRSDLSTLLRRSSIAL
jgi:hypothetical protein